MLEKIISGCQTGSDQAGLDIGLAFGLRTGGFVTRGNRRTDGYRADLIEKYNLTELSTSSYPPRTEQNVINADATVRLFFDKSTPGEKLTKKYIDYYGKPYFDVDLGKTKDRDILSMSVQFFTGWLINNDVRILNIAGNSQQTNPNTYQYAYDYLYISLLKLGFYPRPL